MITTTEWEDIHAVAFKIHRALVRMLGDKHCANARVDIMGGCCCTNQAIKMFLDERKFNGSVP